MDDANVKKLSRILLLIIGLILVIVFIILGKYIFSTDRYGYTLPKKVTRSTTTKVIDYSYHVLSGEEKKIYNEKLIDKIFLLPLNNAIKGVEDVYNVNLIQSDDSKFKYAYTSLALNGEITDITSDLIKEEIKRIFGYSIPEENISNYYNNDKYSYNYNEDYTFCLKATESKEENNKLYLKFDYLSYEEELCNINALDYKTDKEGLIVFNKDNDKYYINSITLMKKEG